MNASISPVTVVSTPAVTLAVDNSLNVTVVPSGTVVSVNYQLQDASGNALISRSTYLTADQWNGWSTSTQDAAYILSCVAANLGLTLAS